MRKRNGLSILAASAMVTLLFVGCGGGGGGGSPNGQSYLATCADGSTKTSTVSVADAAAQCPTVTYSAICVDQSTVTSSISQAAANAKCMPGVVAKVAPSTYTGEKLDAFNQLNADRAQCGFGKLQQNAKLDVAAQGHADWLAANPRVATGHVQDPSTGKGVVTGVQGQDRLQNAGYVPTPWVNYLGTFSSTEVIGVPAWGTLLTCQYCANNASYGKTELSVGNGVRGLYATVYHLAGILMSQRDVGFGVAVGDSSFSPSETLYTKNVVIDTGTVAGWVRQSIPSDTILTFPCQGITNTTPVFGGENPEPFPARGSKEYGQPVYVMGADGTTVTINAASSSITPLGGSPVATTVFNSTVDPLPPTDGRNVKNNQVFLVPTQRLLDNTTYTVVLNGTNTGMVTSVNPTGAYSRTFTFSTLTHKTF